MAGKKKKSTFSYIIAALILSAIITLCLNPVIKLWYPLEYAGIIEENARLRNLDAFLVMGIISAESGFDKNARSHKDAKGLMQITGETAAWCIEKLDVDAPDGMTEDPGTNIAIGCAYFEYLLERYGGNIRTAVAAYNAGPGNVDKWLGDIRYSDGKSTLTNIPFPETRSYVEKVMRRTEIYRKLYE